MGWEARGKTGRYYFRSMRVDGRSRKLYVGQGPIGEAYALLHAEEVLRRKESRRAWDEELARVAAAEAVLARFTCLATTLTRASLIVAGYHCHHGEWRRPREHPESNLQ